MWAASSSEKRSRVTTGRCWWAPTGELPVDLPRPAWSIPYGWPGPELEVFVGERQQLDAAVRSEGCATHGMVVRLKLLPVDAPALIPRRNAKRTAQRRPSRVAIESAPQQGLVDRILRNTLNRVTEAPPPPKRM